MSFTVERNGYTSVQALGRQLATDLIANGFEILAINGSTIDLAPSDATTHYVFRPGSAVDSVNAEWRFVLEASDIDNGYMRFWAVHATQITSDTYIVVNNGATTQSGHMFLGNEVDEPNSYFMNRDTDNSNWSCFKGKSVDPRAIPLSYRLSISDHGISFFTWAESFDRAGDCFSWFTIQRPVQKDGAIVASGKRPLFCVFSWQGGGSTDIALSEDLAAIGDLTQKFVVYESDVNAPTFPTSAVLSGPDSKAIINPLQQVALSEDNTFVVFFPQGINTHRYSYPYELDMIAFTSADVISQNQTVSVSLYDETTPRDYIGMQANFPNNSGLRMLCLVQGAGIS